MPAIIFAANAEKRQQITASFANIDAVWPAMTANQSTKAKRR
jgi:hypothetical protein